MRRAGLVVAVGLCLGLGPAPAQDQQSAAIAAAQQGLEAARQSRYRDAITAYQRALQLDHQLPGLQLNLGLAYFKLGEFQNALPALEKAHAQQPTPQTATLLAMSYVGLGQHKEAAAHLKPLVAAQPENTELAYLLARSYLSSGQYPEAMQVFQSLLQRDPNSAAIHMLLGEALDAYARTAEAADEFAIAARTAPTQPDVHFGLGYLYWKLRRYDEAAKELQAELTRDPAHARAAAYLGDTLLKLGQDAEAQRWLTKAVALDPGRALAHYDLGVIYANNGGQNEEAVTQFRAAAQADPNDYGSHYRLARLLQKLGRGPEAAAEFAIVQKLQEKKTEAPLLKVNGASQ